MNLSSKPSVVAIMLSLVCACSAKCAALRELTVEEHGFAATFYDAPESDLPVGIIALGGSEGGKPVWRAKALAKEGYPVLALAYFKAPGTPDYLDEIPLEYFDEPMRWFAEQPAMRGKKIVLIGGSKGAELALLLASRKREIQGVIAISPGSAVFQGIPKVFWPPRSSWTYKGKPIPFVPYDVSRGVDTNNLRPLYEQSLSHPKKVERAAIEVEKINGPILLLSGKEDGMWPAAEMASSIEQRLAANDFPHSVVQIPYEDAGHTLNEYYMIGGTKEGNQQARVDSWQQIKDFLAKQFK